VVAALRSIVLMVAGEAAQRAIREHRWSKGLYKAPGSFSSLPRTDVHSGKIGSRTRNTMLLRISRTLPDDSGRWATRAAMVRLPTLTQLSPVHGGMDVEMDVWQGLPKTILLRKPFIFGLYKPNAGGGGGIRTCDQGLMSPFWHGRRRSPPFDFPRRDAEKAGSRTVADWSEPGRLLARWMLSGCTLVTRAMQVAQEDDGNL